MLAYYKAGRAAGQQEECRSFLLARIFVAAIAAGFVFKGDLLGLRLLALPVEKRSVKLARGQQKHRCPLSGCLP